MIHLTGSGPVALATALFLLRGGWPARDLFLERQPTRSGPALPAGEAGSPGPTATRRTLALSGGSLQLLDRIIPRIPAGSIRAVHVTLHDRPGQTRIRADDFGEDALGHVVDWHALVGALGHALDQHDPDLGFRIQHAEKPSAQKSTGSFSTAPGPHPAHPHPVAGHLHPPRDLPCLRIHAEGTPTHLDPVSHDYTQHALLIEARTDTDDPTEPVTADHPLHAGAALECFAAAGPIALLPMADPAHWSVVWCDTPAETARRMTLPDAALCAELRARIPAPWRPGLRVLPGRQSAPLVRRTHQTTFTPGSPAGDATIWIGNAAQTLHPVAGQGLNLGLRDAFELARCLTDFHDERRTGRATNAEFMMRLSQLDHSRQADRRRMRAVTDLMARAPVQPWLRPGQSLLLDLLDCSSVLRQPLARTLLYGRRTA